jgi:hypothetical protein
VPEALFQVIHKHPQQPIRPFSTLQNRDVVNQNLRRILLLAFLDVIKPEANLVLRVGI